MNDNGERKLVLVVDDQDVVRMTMVEVLTDAGFDVTDAESGDLALRLLQGTGCFDLVVTDIDMPGSADGNVVGREAKRVRPETAVLYVTGRPERLTNHLGAREALMAKPFRLAAMIRVVGELLA